MKNLNPTLWRTCRMLAGRTRMRLLRQLHDHPGRNVSTLAKAIGIGPSDASQELRRIQSRGLLQTEYRGANLLYRFGADPQVGSAAPILKALRAGLDAGPDQDEVLRTMAKALGHRKRIDLLRSLMESPKTSRTLQQELHMADRSIRRHLPPLMDSGLVRLEARLLHYVPPVHPLAKTLVRLLPD